MKSPIQMGREAGRGPHRYEIWREGSDGNAIFRGPWRAPAWYVRPMIVDVIDLRDFYSQRLGIVARRLINRGIRARWRDAQGRRVLGLGYPTPYLGLFREDSERCIAFMPAAQGVLKWPTARPTLASLVDQYSLPLPDASVDRILLVHALELSDDPEGLLREVWRVLAPSGRVIAVIPNRRGVWTRTDATPFGHGRPYSRSQITQLLRQTWFTPTAW